MIESLNPLFHDRVRLGILLLLYREGEVDFSTLKQFLHLTDGNLASHLRKLENAGVIEVKKTFKGRKPKTYYRFTEEGYKQFKAYLIALSQLLNQTIGKD